jgi:hypothetical protein
MAVVWVYSESTMVLRFDDVIAISKRFAGVCEVVRVERPVLSAICLRRTNKFVMGQCERVRRMLWRKR